MASAQPHHDKAPGAQRSRSFAAGHEEAQFGQELDRLAALAWSVFATRSEACAWLACAVRQPVRGGGERQWPACSEVSAAACAVRFNGACSRSSTPRQFASVVVGLPTPQLEALLALREDACP